MVLASPIANAGRESITNGEDERELEFEPHISIGDGECNERCLDSDGDRGPRLSLDHVHAVTVED